MGLPFIIALALVLSGCRLATSSIVGDGSGTETRSAVDSGEPYNPDYDPRLGGPPVPDSWSGSPPTGKEVDTKSNLNPGG